MACILMSELEVFIDDNDLNLFNQFKWYIHKSSKSIYVRGYEKGKVGLKYLHRLLMNPKKGQDIDHINGNGLDNRRSNLRICNRSENNANRKRVQSKTSIYKGVHLEKQTGKWRAEITFQNKAYKLGRFSSQEMAADAYFEKAKELFGDFAHKASKLDLNFSKAA